MKASLLVRAGRRVKTGLGPAVTLVMAVGAMLPTDAAVAGVLREGLTRAALATVAATPLPGAQLPLHARGALHERASLLVFVDFDCPSLCDPVMTETATRLLETGLGTDGTVGLVVIGIDPRDDAEAARSFTDRRVPSPLRPFLTVSQPDAASLASITEALGYVFLYDAQTQRFAHPAVRYVLTAEGRVSRVLPASGVDANDLRRALVEAGEGRVGTLGDRIALACYGFDPVSGRYSLAVERILVATGTATALAMALGIGIALRREFRRGASNPLHGQQADSLNRPPREEGSA